MSLLSAGPAWAAHSSLLPLLHAAMCCWPATKGCCGLCKQTDLQVLVSCVSARSPLAACCVAGSGDCMGWLVLIRPAGKMLCIWALRWLYRFPAGWNYFLRREDARLARSIISLAVPSCQIGAFHSLEELLCFSSGSGSRSNGPVFVPCGGLRIASRTVCPRASTVAAAKTPACR